MIERTVPSSFRDPSGFLFYEDDSLYRQVNACYREDYELLMHSGLYDALARDGLLIEHGEVSSSLQSTPEAYRVIQPQLVPFISYPYEWSFSQLKDAALLTLEIQRKALANDMSLKDASAYNIQFFKGKPIFIDTLSFTKYVEGDSWAAYRQFCQHFLAPLALMAHTDVRLCQLLRIYIDGIPLELANKLLPMRRKWNFSLGLHITLHARNQEKYAAGAGTSTQEKRPSFPRRSFTALLSNLTSSVKNLTWNPGKTEWDDYYAANNNYGTQGLDQKERLISELIRRVDPNMVWDLGANTGRFSRIVAAQGAQVVSWDIDPSCVENNYKEVRRQDDSKILPLLLDLTNPSPAIGWNNVERESFAQRGPVDLVLALGLIHHLAIANNVPLDRIAASFSSISRWLVIEFVPKEDTQVKKLLSSRVDIFPDYTLENFEKIFGDYFAVEETIDIAGTKRTLYCMKRKDR